MNDPIASRKGDPGRSWHEVTKYLYHHLKSIA